ncbi:type II secretion system protein GspM [Thiotrichales bacterium HSG1]|nr:type II secretion system protein GspM [Thiotrichales bacterium HSG1]
MNINQLFKRLTNSEQRTIILGIIITIVASTYFLVWEPFVNSYQQIQNIVTVQKQNLNWMTNAANEVQQLRGHTSKSNTLGLIDESIRNSNLNKVDKRIEPKDKQKVLVIFTNVDFTKLVQWLSKLYNQHQIQVNTINIEHQPISGQVTAKLTLQ